MIAVAFNNFYEITMFHEVSMKPNAMKFLCYMKIYNF